MKKSVYKHLKLVHLEAALPQVLERARTEQWTYETFLERALGSELDGREQKALARRLKAARIPCKKTLDGFEFSFQPSRTLRRLRELADLADVANLHQPRVSWSSRNRENPSEPGPCGSGARGRLFGALYDAGRPSTDPGECVTSRLGAATSASLHRAESAGHR
jgi:DNA replication protein DnaC